MSALARKRRPRPGQNGISAVLPEVSFKMQICVLKRQPVVAPKSRRLPPLRTTFDLPAGPEAADVAASSSRRRAATYRRDASRFEGARLQCRAPLVDGVIEQFEHQAKGRQFLFLDGTVIAAFKRVTDDGVDLALHRQQFLVGFRGTHSGNHGQDSIAM